MTINGFFFGRNQNLNNGHCASGRKCHCKTVRTRNLSLEPLESRDLLSVAANPLDADDAAYVSPAALPTVTDSLSVDFPTTNEQTALQANYSTPSGYNHNDYQKMVAFLEQTDESGVKNGKKISASYNPSDPTTWGDYSSWDGVFWSTENGEKRIYYISVSYLQMVGSANFSEFTKLQWLYCNNNQLESLDVSGCSIMTFTNCESNQLRSVNYTGCSALSSFYCGKNQLTYLDFSDFSNLTTLNCYSNQLESLGVSGCASLEKLICYSNQIKSLDVSGCVSLKSLYCYSNKIKALDVSDCALLETLNCHSNQLESLDVFGCASLKSLDCDSNQLESLDVSGCSSLETLYCSHNPLSDLNVSSCFSLTSLFCYYCQLTSLNVSNLSSLTSLYCYYNQLESLKVSGCASLKDFDCAGNQLKTLDISSCASLEELGCNNNLLETLNVSNNVLLKELYCGSNQLKSLDVSSCTSLEDLNCASNKLTSLDVSNVTSLTSIRCLYNKLTSLNVSNLTSLEALYCGSNLLTSLDVSDCTSLKYLFCEYNDFYAMDVSNCTNLKCLSVYNYLLKNVVLPSNRSDALTLEFDTSSTWTIKNSAGNAIQTNIDSWNPFELSSSTALPIYAETTIYGIPKTVLFTNVLPALNAPNISNVSARSSSAITVTVEEVSDARYYEVQYSKSSNFTNASSKVISSGSTTISGLDANTTYYFHVKAINGQYCQDSAYSAVKSAKTLQTSQDNESLSATLVSGVLTITGTTKDDWVEIEQGSQNIVVHQYDAQGTTQLKTWSFNANSVDSIKFSGDAGNDVFKSWYRGTNKFASKATYAEGGDGDDVLIGGSGNDVLFGGEGDDYLDGADGDNQIVTGNGADTTANTGIGSNVYVWMGYQDFKQWSSGSALGDDDVLLRAVPISTMFTIGPDGNVPLTYAWTENVLRDLFDELNAVYEKCGHWKLLALPVNKNESEILYGHDYYASVNFGRGVYLLDGSYACVHEFGHFWDEENNPYWEEFYTISWDYNPDNNRYTYKPGCDTNSSSSGFEFTDNYGAESAFEDWAQCVRTVVYNYNPLNVGNGGEKINAKFAVVEKLLAWLSTTSNDFSMPTNLSVTSKTSTSITLGWENVSGSPGYTFLYSTSSDFTNASSMSVASNSAIITGLNADTTYYFKIKTNGNDDIINSSYSPASSAKTLLPNQLITPTLSAAVTGFDSVSVTVGRVDHASKYEVEYSLNSNFSNSTVREVQAGVTTISGLNRNATYYFRVRAIGQQGYVNSEYSSTSINVKLPISASVQNKSVNHSSSSSMAKSVERLTDWDDCYIELWTPGVNALNSGQTTVTFSYNPDVYNTPSITSCSAGVSMNLSQRTQLSNGDVQYTINIQVSKTISSQTNNLYLGTVVLTPLSEDNAGLEDSQNPIPVCALNGADLLTTVQPMPFDLERDNIINVNDFIKFATVFGYNWKNMTPDNSNYANAVKADYDKDGTVDVNDFITFATYFGRSKSAAAQPISQASPAAPQVENNEFEQNVSTIVSIEEKNNAPSSDVPFLVFENKIESSMTLREAYSAALLDLYDNQNNVDLLADNNDLAELRIENSNRSSDDAISRTTPNSAAINAVLEEELLAIDWKTQQ